MFDHSGDKQLVVFGSWYGTWSSIKEEGQASSYKMEDADLPTTWANDNPPQIIPKPLVYIYRER